MRPFYFLHIPKTAGTTLTAWLDQHYAAEDILPKGYFGKNPLHVTREEFEHKRDSVQHYLMIHGHYGNDVLNAFFPTARSITILRDPASRVVSLYNDWRTKSDENHAKAPQLAKELIEIARTHTLGEFLRCGHELCEWQFRDGQARQLVSALYLNEPADPDAACAALDTIDIVGTTELLRPTAILIARMMNWTEPGPMSPLNTTRGSVTLNQLDPSTREIIHEMTQADQIVYRYAQSILADQLSKLLIDAPRPAPAPLGACPESTEIRVDEPIDGNNWHVLEGEDQKWRWTGPGRITTMQIPLTPHTTHRIVLRVVSVIAEDIIEGTHLLLNGHPLDVVHAGVVDGQIELHALAPASCVSNAPMSTLSILVPRTMPHSEIQPETQDHRLKGLAITSVRITRSNLSES